ENIGLARRMLQCQAYDRGRKPVAGFEPVRYQEIHDGAHAAQSSHADRAGCRAVAVVVRNDQHALAAMYGVRQNTGCLLDVRELSWRNQSTPYQLGVAEAAYAARRPQTRQ